MSRVVGAERMTLEELAALLREEEQRAESEELTGKLAPVLRRMRGYLDLLEEVCDPVDEYEQLIDAEPAGKMMGHGKRYMWDHARDFPFAYKIGNRWKYSPSGIRRYLKRRAA